MPYYLHQIARSGRSASNDDSTSLAEQKIRTRNTLLVGESNRQYRIEHVLHERVPSRPVCIAASEGEMFITKEVNRGDYAYLRSMQHDLGNNPYLRLLHDAVPAQGLFIYRYLTNDLLSLGREDLLTTRASKRILRDSLRGLAALHDQDIVHADIKANNILVEYHQHEGAIVLEQVRLSDLEDAARVPPGSNIMGSQVGNQWWRSPEAHAQGRVNKPSDMFSFGVVCIFTVLKRVIFFVDEGELGEGEETLARILERQMSFFADQEGLDGLLTYLGDSPWCDVLRIIRDGFNEDNPRKPFSLWKNVDQDFKDLVVKLMNFDPTKRLTVHEALAHPYFKDCPDS